MPKQRSYCFTAITEMRGVMGSSSWAQPSMRAAINLGTGPWFCLFVDEKYRAAVEMGSFLVRLGFENAYEFAKQEKDSRKLAKAALDWRAGRLDRLVFEEVRTAVEQKYARNFESRPLMVAARLASDNPCCVASATCIDGVGADHIAIRNSILEYAQRVLKP